MGPTLSCQEAPPCTLVLLTVCRRKSPLLLLPPSRSRSSLPQRGNTPSGSEDPSLLPSPPSNRCGSPSRSTTSLVHLLCTENAFKLFFYFLYCISDCCRPMHFCTDLGHCTLYL